jgi:hypothetical protein
MEIEIVKLWKYRSIEKVLWSFGLDKHLSFVLCEAFDERQGWVEIDKSTLVMKDDCKNQFKAMCILKYFYDSVKANQEPNPYIKINMKTDEARKALIELAENVYTVAAKEGQKDFVELGIKKIDSFLEKVGCNTNSCGDNVHE